MDEDKEMNHQQHKQKQYNRTFFNDDHQNNHIYISVSDDREFDGDMISDLHSEHQSTEVKPLDDIQNQQQPLQQDSYQIETDDQIFNSASDFSDIFENDGSFDEIEFTFPETEPQNETQDQQQQVSHFSFQNKSTDPMTLSDDEIISTPQKTETEPQNQTKNQQQQELQILQITDDTIKDAAPKDMNLPRFIEFLEKNIGGYKFKLIYMKKLNDMFSKEFPHLWEKISSQEKRDKNDYFEGLRRNVNLIYYCSKINPDHYWREIRELAKKKINQKRRKS